MLGPDIGYADIIDHMTTERLKKEMAEGKHISKSPLRPSSAGNCTRELAHALSEYHKLATYEREVNEPEMERIFKLGYSVERHVLDAMRDTFKDLFEIRYTQQVLSFVKLVAKNKPQLAQWLEGSLDGVLYSAQNKCIFDVKSKKVKWSNYRKDNWDEFSYELSRMSSVKKITDKAFWVEDLEAFLTEVNDPFLAANFLQLNLYALNPFIVERGIDHAAILQYSKNDSRLREIRFKPSPKLYDYVINKMQLAMDAVDQDNLELAPKEFQLGSIKCAFCNYKTTCWSDSDPLKAFFKALPPKRWPKDTNRLGDAGAVLEEIYADMKGQQVAMESFGKLENELLEALLEEEVDKVRFADGEVYEVKLLKSPREHFELRRSKT